MTMMTPAVSLIQTSIIKMMHPIGSKFSYLFYSNQCIKGTLGVHNYMNYDKSMSVLVIIPSHISGRGYRNGAICLSVCVCQ